MSGRPDRQPPRMPIGEVALPVEARFHPDAYPKPGVEYEKWPPKLPLPVEVREIHPGPPLTEHEE